MATLQQAVQVPYAAPALQMRRIKEQILAAIERVLEHGNYILGPEVQEFETQFAGYCGTRYAVGVSSGTSALVLGLQALGIGPGDEVITAPNSFVASASCAALVGAKPTFVDVRRPDMNLDPDRVEAAITPRTRAIIAVHLTGHPADMDRILEIGRAHRIPVIEDAAQAVGTVYHGRRTGSMGLLGCFSMHPLKNLHAYGDAGAITTNDEELYRRLLKARNHGLRDRENVEFWSPNARLDTLHAAVLSVQLKCLDRWIMERRAIAAEYCAALGDVVQVPEEAPGCMHTYQTFMIKAEQRPGLLAHLQRKGIDAKVHYPTLLHTQEAAKALGYRPDAFPVARWLADRIVSLPLSAELTPEQRTAVTAGVRSFYVHE